MLLIESCCSVFMNTQRAKPIWQQAGCFSAAQMLNSLVFTKTSFKISMKCKTENLYSYWRFRFLFRSILPEPADKKVLWIFKLCFTENQRHANTWEKPLQSLDIALQHLPQLFCVDFQFFGVKLQMLHNPLEKFSLYKSILLQEIWAQLLEMQCWH